jgi:2-oxoglutarate dehydrogenase E2 component (dihydrolipoamide succinyltransferase)
MNTELLVYGFLVAVKEALENPLELLMGGNAKKALEL